MDDGREFQLDLQKVLPIINSIVSRRQGGADHIYSFVALSDYFSGDQFPTLWEKDL